MTIAIWALSVVLGYLPIVPPRPAPPPTLPAHAPCITVCLG